MRDRVQQLLARQGPMAASEAAAWLNTRPESVYSALRLWRRANPAAWHVSGWKQGSFNPLPPDTSQNRRDLIMPSSSTLLQVPQHLLSRLRRLCQILVDIHDVLRLP